MAEKEMIDAYITYLEGRGEEICVKFWSKIQKGK
jgi:hypothetical protein